MGVFHSCSGIEKAPHSNILAAFMEINFPPYGHWYQILLFPVSGMHPYPIFSDMGVYLNIRGKENVSRGSGKKPLRQHTIAFCIS